MFSLFTELSLYLSLFSLRDFYSSEVFETYDFFRGKSEKLRGSSFPDVLPLDPNVFADSEFITAFFWVFGEVASSDFEILVQIGNGEFDWVDYSKSSGGGQVQLFPEDILQEMEGDYILIAPPGDPDAVAELIDGLRSVTPPSESVQSENSRVVPTLHVAFEN